MVLGRGVQAVRAFHDAQHSGRVQKTYRLLCHGSQPPPLGACWFGLGAGAWLGVFVCVSLSNLSRRDVFWCGWPTHRLWSRRAPALQTPNSPSLAPFQTFSPNTPRSGLLTHHLAVGTRIPGCPIHSVAHDEPRPGTAACSLMIESAESAPALESVHGGPVIDCVVRLVTGRTHQIRAQMAAVGHPLVGDTLYGPLARRPGQVKGFVRGNGGPTTSGTMRHVRQACALVEWEPTGCCQRQAGWRKASLAGPTTQE